METILFDLAFGVIGICLIAIGFLSIAMCIFVVKICWQIIKE